MSWISLLMLPAKKISDANGFFLGRNPSDDREDAVAAKKNLGSIAVGLVNGNICKTNTPGAVGRVSRQRTSTLMLFDNVQWKQHHRMTKESFCDLNRRMRYGVVNRLIPETVSFEAGNVVVDAEGIEVDTSAWNPPKGVAKGQFYAELPLNGIRLSIFVFRPATELFVYRPVRKDVLYQKPDEATVVGSSDWCCWVGSSTRGPSHRNDDGICREDDMSSWCDEKEKTLYLVVTDGAGSAKYSRVGSAVMASEFIQYFKHNPLCQGALSSDEGVAQAKLACIKATRSSLTELDRRREEIAKDSSENGLSLRAFHTTLNVAIMQKDSVGVTKILSFAVGDGAVVICPEHGEIVRLNIPDRGAYASQTEFVTSSSVLPDMANKDELSAFCKRRFETAEIHPRELGRGFIGLMTDGVCEDVKSWRDFADATIPIAAMKNGEELTKWLNGRNAENFDDKTLLMATLGEEV